MKTVLAASLFFLGLVGSCHGAAHPAAEPSSLGDHMQSFTEDPYMTDEKFREKGRSLEFFLHVTYDMKLLFNPLPPKYLLNVKNATYPLKCWNSKLQAQKAF